MKLSPSEAEQFLRSDDDWERLRGPAAYAFALHKPDDLEAEWDQHFDHRPKYWDQLVEADSVIYVGGTKDLLGRLEDHREGEVRVTVLMTICEIGELRNVWWADDRDQFLIEPQLADALTHELPPSTYVHQR